MFKKVLRAALALLALYLAWLAASELAFRRRGNPNGEAAAAAPAPGGAPVRELRGVYHVHTAFSDGRSSVDEVAAHAARQGLDFIVLADHGDPNVASLRSGGRRIGGVLVLAGSELSVNRGHLVALGFRLPDGPLPGKAEDAVDAVRALGGFAVIAHPYSKVRWSWGDPETESGYSGIEIVNADTMFKNNYRRVLAYAPLLLLGSRLPLVRMLEPPAANLKRWDRMGANAPAAGYFSADAHLYYRGLFALLRLHVLLEGEAGAAFGRDGEADTARLWDSLRRGRFYNAVDAVADARGFRFGAEAGGGRVLGMGDTLAGTASGVRLEARAPFPFRGETRLLRDGRVIAATRASALSAPAEGPGVYRVEVYLRERSPLGPDFPWIVSNPIYVRKD